LLLDHHVNRPAHPRKHLALALEQTGLSRKEPNSWSSQDEAKLIEAYLAIRAQSSMTKPEERAATTQRFLHSGKLSDARGSFQVQAMMATRSLNAETTSPVFFPDHLGEGDFPAIGGDGGSTTGEEVSLSKGNWFARVWKSIFG
jgi:hypothetical protein